MCDPPNLASLARLTLNIVKITRSAHVLHTKHKTCPPIYTSYIPSLRRTKTNVVLMLLCVGFADANGRYKMADVDACYGGFRPPCTIYILTHFTDKQLSQSVLGFALGQLMCSRQAGRRRCRGIPNRFGQL
jgi:hypothetical protein